MIDQDKRISKKIEYYESRAPNEIWEHFLKWGDTKDGFQTRNSSKFIQKLDKFKLWKNTENTGITGIRYRKIPKYRYTQKPDTEKYRNTGIAKNPIPKNTEIPVSKKPNTEISVFLETTFFLKIQRNFHLIFSKKRVNLTPMEKLLVQRP